MSPEAALVFSNQMSEIDTALGRQGGGGGYHQYRVRIRLDQACKVYYYICMSVVRVMLVMYNSIDELVKVVTWNMSGLMCHYFRLLCLEPPMTNRLKKIRLMAKSQP